MRAPSILMLWVLIIFAATIARANDSNRFRSTYAGQENRAIKSLSDEDIKELTSGSGWGLAKAAELNGAPGPKHLLEMKEKIDLSPEQEKAIETLFAAMKERAVALGHELIRLEGELNHRFASKNIDERGLKSLLRQIATTYMELRFVHLSTHLKTPAILSEDQINTYNRLRG